VGGYNKIDLLDGHTIRHNDSENPGEGVFVSAVRGDGIEDLLERVETMLFPSKQRWQLMIPPERGDILARLYRLGRVTGRKNQEQGVRIEAEVPVQLTDIFLPFRVIEAGQRQAFSKKVC
jgi:GTP-binding protein HflX